jgi:hypothetical protein
MEQQPEIPNEVILTTETRQHLVRRIILLLFFGATGLMVSWASYLGRFTPFGLIGDGFLGLLTTLVFLSTFVINGTAPLGTWVIDSEGVRYRLYRWRHRFLRWDSVERLKSRNSDYCLTFKGNDIKIRLNLHLFPEELSRPAHGIIETQLASEFDLKPVIENEKFTFSGEQRRRLVQWIAISVGITGAVFGAYFLGTYLHPEFEGLFRIGLGVVVMPFLCVAQALPYLVLRWEEDRVGRRIHPEWPWRVRRSKTQPKNLIDREFELA